MEKEQLRQLINHRLASLTAKERAVEDAAITKRVLKTTAWQDAKTIFCYVGFGSEIDTYPLLKAALKQGKRLAVPDIKGYGIMEAKQLFDTEALQPGRYAIPAPPKDSPLVLANEIDLVIVPGLVFERRSLQRLGRGGGYYDRYLQNCPAVRLAPVRSCQLVESLIDKEAYDIPMDMLVMADDIYVGKV